MQTVSQRLTPAQAEVLEAGLLTSGFSCILHMPTGSGKTWLAEHAIDGVLHAGLRSIYLTPLRALAEELHPRWSQRFGTGRVGVFTGDYGSGTKPPPVPFRDARVLIMTPERLDACTRHWRVHWEWLPEVDLVVADEFHLLGDPHRGGRMEGALLRLQRLNPFCRVLGLSATLGNTAELADWLHGTEYVSTWRPVTLEWRTVRYRKADEKPGLLTTEAKATALSGGQTLVFTQSRRRAETLARGLADEGLRVAHHHAGLSAAERRKAELGFRGADLQVMVSTATLEMGLNLPARKVVLYDLQEFDGTGFRPLPTNTVWQRAGRAGRPGQDSAGEVVLFAPVWDRDVDRYLRGRFEPIRSALADKRVLTEQIMAELSSGLCFRIPQIGRTFGLSLAARQGILPDVTRSVVDMINAGIVERTDDRESGARGEPAYRVTRLGRVAARQMLFPETVIVLKRVADLKEPLTVFDLLLTVAATEDCEPLIPVDFEEVEALAQMLAAEPSQLLARSGRLVASMLACHGRRLLTALKTALLMRAWSLCGSQDEVADSFGCYPFEIRRLQESFGRILPAFRAVAGGEGKRAHTGVQPFVIDLVNAMVAAGVDLPVASLTLVDGVGPVFARRLAAAGIGDLPALARLQDVEKTAIKGVRPERLAKWAQAARDRQHPDLRALTGSAPATTFSMPSRSPVRVDPYRLRRAVDLSVEETARGHFTVTGGLEPHVVAITRKDAACDCADFANGNLCKHILAVRLRSGNRSLKADVRRLTPGRKRAAIDLFELWSERAPAPTPASGVPR